ncbi:Fe-S cluster assembly sulfur transfer protein SufU [Silvanigrella aquatica]|nr:SUF system NifU family Fe-S cluster assembly protein [Silvanigrella aquatica]
MTENLNTSQSIELNSLYQEVIVDHSRRPRFKSKNMQCRFCQEGKNPLCGDIITVFCQIEMKDSCPLLSIGFDGAGCSISQASASIMCNSLQNVTLQEAQKTISHAENIYTGKIAVNAHDLDEDIEALNGVSKFPVRVKCAALPWKTLDLLLNDNFDKNGMPKSGCDKLENCVKSSNNQRKLKIVTTEF